MIPGAKVKIKFRALRMKPLYFDARVFIRRPRKLFRLKFKVCFPGGCSERGYLVQHANDAAMFFMSRNGLSTRTEVGPWLVDLVLNHLETAPLPPGRIEWVDPFEA